MRLIEVTVTVSAPGPFDDDEAQAFVDWCEDKIVQSVQDVTRQIVTDATSIDIPLSDVARVDVS